MATKVVLKQGQSLEDALRRLRQLIQRDQIPKEIKKRKYFTTRRALLIAKKKRRF